MSDNNDTHCTLALPRITDVPQVVVLADGDYPSHEIPAAQLANAAAVVCCDGAAVEYICRGGKPAAIVGDCDSLPQEISERYADIIHRFAEQETNDLTKSVNYCIAAGYTDITILGATGKREDHTLGNVSLLVDYMYVATVRMVTDHGIFNPINKDTRLESYPGQQVSIFTLDPRTLITTGDLQYSLTNAPLKRWWPGTLNQSIADEFYIGTTGEALIYRLYK